MRFRLISDNTDTLTGMRLAGIPGVVANTAPAVDKALDEALADPGIGILVMTQKAASLSRERVEEQKRASTLPLIVEIPDRHGYDGELSVTKYISEAVGLSD